MTELRQLGKYQIIEVLGKGAMGIVYKGFDPMIERYVALKTVRMELMDQDHAGELLARFKNEAQAAGRLMHPGIVGVHEFGEDQQTTFIAMEFVQGQGLRDFLRLHRLGLQDSVKIMEQLLDALGFAHEHGVVHRDIKPANIIIMPTGKVKVADFGIARMDTSNLTLAGSVMGTPSYMSPEQYTGQAVDQRTDIFSAGVVFYQMLTGSKPFNGSTETVGYKICHERHKDPSEIEPKNVPMAFDTVLARALAKKVDDRYATAKEFANAMLAAFQCEAAAAGSEVTVLNTILPPPTDKPETTFPPPGWKPDELREVEELFTPHVGPMARLLVKRAAKETIDPIRLVSLLAENIPAERERSAFQTEALSKLSACEGLGSVIQGACDPAQSGLDAAEVDKATARLAPYLGPIAKVLTKKAAARSENLRTFYMCLAESLADPADRARFLADAGYG